jgi:hypothetical protein
MRLVDLDITVKDLDFGGVDAESDRRLADYFIDTPQVDEALGFRSAHFIGRKGSGKSSIFTQLPRLAADRYGEACRVSLMTPDQYAWGALRQYEERGLLPEQAHSNAWKFTIAVDAAAAALEAPAELLDEDARKALEQIRGFVARNCGTDAPGCNPPSAPLTRRLMVGGCKGASARPCHISDVKGRLEKERT